VTFAIRNPDGTLIGVVGAGHLEVGTTHRANLGYWLAKPYWGQGIMTRAVRCYVRYALTHLDVVRLTAEVFCRNEASIRVLEKVGFRREGRLRKHRAKDGDLLDAYFYGLLREDVEDKL
jgi:RimJ/RimL family protein N-acetyltransferase